MFGNTGFSFQNPDLVKPNQKEEESPREVSFDKLFKNMKKFKDEVNNNTGK